MKSLASARGTLAVALVLVSTIAGAQTWKPPAESARCPSKWGASDERGSANHMTPALVLNAARLIRTGEVIELGRVLRAGMPIQATRRFDLHTKRTVMNPQSNQRGSNEEVVTTELGQVGTQFDGFAHQSHGDSLYNCFKISDTSTRTGFNKLGIENVGHPHDARRADRCRRTEGGGHAARHLRDHGAGPAAGTAEAQRRRYVPATPCSSIPVGDGCGKRTTRAT